MIFLLKIFISQNILLFLVYVFLLLLRYFKNSVKLNYTFILKISYLGILCAFIFPIIFYLMNLNEVIPAYHQVLTPLGGNKNLLTSVVGSVDVISNGINKSNMENSFYFPIFFTVFSGIILFNLCKYLKDYFKIKKILKNSLAYKKRSFVEVLFHEKIQVPFSSRIINKFYVVVPYVLIEDYKKLKMIVSHELQHHRQGDTSWVYFIIFSKYFFALNPFVFLLERAIYEFQELACDEVLARTKKITPHAYCDCLLWAAQFSLQRQEKIAGTANFLRLNATQFLKKRIQTMLNFKQRKNSKISAVLLSVTLLGSLSLVAYAASSVTQDRKITMQSAEIMLKNAQVKTKFPIVLNERVLEQLNRFLGNYEGREFVKQSLENRKKYNSMIHMELKKENLPLELAAIPIVESGYKNMAQNSEPYSAGIWMFIPATARVMGLNVDTKNDERMNDNLETKAAAKLFLELYGKYQDWNLAIMAYNYGSDGVDNLIKNASSHDAWKLIESLPKDVKYNEPRNYLPSVIAAMLIEKNPSYLK